jgi:dimeric dUTPase (all-alpha-NTP-PPase superfamily)
MFQTQREVDKLIRETQKIEEDTVDRKIIAFKVEFGEFLNEHKFFKFWKVDKSPNRFKWDRDKENKRFYVESDPMLEEFVDGIAFMLAIALERKWDKFLHGLEVVNLEDKTLSALSIDIFHNPLSSAGNWLQCLLDMLQFAFLVGLTVEEIESAYELKSQVNLIRQLEGY